MLQSARNEKMRIKSNINLGSLLGGPEVGLLSAPCSYTAVDELHYRERLWQHSLHHRRLQPGKAFRVEVQRSDTAVRVQGVFDGAISNRLKAMAPTTTIDEVRKVSSLHSASSCRHIPAGLPDMLWIDSQQPLSSSRALSYANSQDGSKYRLLSLKQRLHPAGVPGI